MVVHPNPLHTVDAEKPLARESTAPAQMDSFPHGSCPANAAEIRATDSGTDGLTVFRNAGSGQAVPPGEGGRMRRGEAGVHRPKNMMLAIIIIFVIVALEGVYWHGNLPYITAQLLVQRWAHVWGGAWLGPPERPGPAGGSSRLYFSRSAFITGASCPFRPSAPHFS